MAHQEYLIEAMEPSGRWYILGSSRSNGDAQDFMREYRKLFAKVPLRVVEHSSRIIVVLNDPNVCASCGGARCDCHLHIPYTRLLNVIEPC